MRGRHGQSAAQPAEHATAATGPSAPGVERFAEPAVLLLLRERPMHGYELLELLPPLVGEERIDVGNLYRFLRTLEEEGVVASEWSADLPGPGEAHVPADRRGRASCSPPGPSRSAARRS